MAEVSFVLFDLDGTLTDPGLGITNSVMYAMRAHGMEPPPRKELYSVIGPPLMDSFRRICAVGEQKAREMVDSYREYFADKGIFENRVYPGIPQMLSRLKDAGKTLLVATSKPELFARRIIEHYGLADFFAYVGGCNLDETRTRKAEVIAYVLDSAGAQAERSVMVGDRMYDIAGAKECGMRSVGVLYGYGTRGELEQAGADHIAATSEEAADIILRIS